MATDYSQVRYERRGAIGLLTLHRPDRLNAWTPSMAAEQADAIERANADHEVGAIVMTGEGRGFCAGADMEVTFRARIEGRDPGEDTASGQGGMPAGLDWVALLRRSKPIVAAVNGAAVGIGTTMILPCDVIVASDKARFGMVFIKVGLVPELASTHFLVQRIGFGRASEMCLSGRLYGGEEAHRIGLADHLTSAENLLPKAFEIAEAIAANPDRQLRMTKQLLGENACDGDLVAVQERESALLRQCWTSAEHKEAVAAFLEKRPPRFR
jgi:enoyl-CoA hydratase/carnithine racemase